MRVNDNNQSVLARIRQAVATFASGRLELDDIQAVLQSGLGLLENDGSGVIDLVRLAEADIEEIRFTQLLDEQRPAVAFRLDALLDALPCDRR